MKWTKYNVRLAEKLKKVHLVMTMRKRISGGVHFVANKETKGKSESFFSTQASALSQSLHATNIPTQTSVDMDDNKKDDDDEDDSKVEFFLELENTKNLNSLNYFIEKMNIYLNEKIYQINVEVNRIKNYLLRNGLEENKENYNALKNVI